MRVEKVEIGTQKPRIHPLVVVDKSHQRRLGLLQPPVAGIRHAGALLRDEPQGDARMRLGKIFETHHGIVRGVVVHHHAFPHVRRQVLAHDGFKRRDELCGTVMGGDDE